MNIRTKDVETSNILNAALNGDIDTLAQVDDVALTKARCNSGCTALHWAAGNNQVECTKYLVLERGMDADIEASKKSRGRTPLHYSCRNGCFEASVWLVEEGGATIDARAKHDVSPFQMAIWQNQLRTCQYLVEDKGVDPCQLNAFDCGAVHWLGICPAGRANHDDPSTADGRGLLPLARWLSMQNGIDFKLKQRQGHTPLHKAAWGGHLALIRYLRDEHHLFDEHQDDAGNFAADLADMANTPKHSLIAAYLRESCSKARSKSCAILGVDVSADMAEIRRAYLEKAKMLHPDRVSTQSDNIAQAGEDEIDTDFDTIVKAYEHLIKEGGGGKQRNPAHSINLMLTVSGQGDRTDNESLFKARLIAVLLEYGSKGLDVSNVKRKWKQVWPDISFPNYADSNKGDSGSSKATGKRVGSITLSEFLLKSAGDVIELKKDGKGTMKVHPKGITQETVSNTAKMVAEPA